MADIAKLGMVVEAKGVDEASQKLTQLAQTGKLAAGQLVYMAGGAESASGGVDRAGRAAGGAGRSMGQLKGSLSLVAQEFGALGPTASSTASILTGLLSRITPIGLASAALAATVGLLVSRYRDYKQSLEDNEKEDFRLEQAFVKRRHSLAELNAETERSIRVNTSLDPQLQEINERYDQRSDALKKLGASEANLQRLEQERSGALAKVGNERLDAASREQQAIQDQVTGIRFQIAALGASGSATIALSTAQRVNDILTSELAKKHGVLAGQLAAEADQLGRVQIALSRINSGQQALSQFQQNFGVTFDFDRDAAARSLAANFAATFQALKHDPTAQGALNEAFASLVSQLSATGTGNIGGLLESLGLNFKDLAQLRASLRDLDLGFVEIAETQTRLGQSAAGSTQLIEQEVTRLVPVSQLLTDAFERSNQKLQSWGQGFQDAAARNAEAASDIGQRMEEFNATTQNAVNTVAQLRAALASIPDVIRKQIVLDIQTSGGGLQAFEQFYGLSTGLDFGTRVYP